MVSDHIKETDDIARRVDLQGEMFGLRTRAEIDRNEWLFRFQEMTIQTDLHREKCDREIERLDQQIVFLVDALNIYTSQIEDGRTIPTIIDNK